MADHPILTLEFAPRAVFRRVIEAEEAFLRVAASVAEDVTDNRASLEWRLVTASSNGVIRLQITPEATTPELSQQGPTNGVDAVVDGVAQLESSDARPPHFTDETLEGIERLSKLRDEVG